MLKGVLELQSLFRLEKAVKKGDPKAMKELVTKMDPKVLREVVEEQIKKKKKRQGNKRDEL